MHSFLLHSATPSTFRRVVGACAALGASAAVLGSVLASFGAASSSAWLPDTPEAIARAGVCEKAAARAGRDPCMRETLARWQTAERGEIRVAGSR